MDDRTASEIERCQQLVYRLEQLTRQDSEQMENCTRGQVLNEYRAVMDKQMQRLQQIKRLLRNISVS